MTAQRKATHTAMPDLGWGASVKPRIIMRRPPEKTVKCFHADCDAEIVRIERYHARNGLPWDGVAVWELVDGAWKPNGEWYDQGTHFHVFCADYEKGFASANWHANRLEASIEAHDRGEFDWCEDCTACEPYEARCECTYSDWQSRYDEEHPLYDTPAGGHEFKRWGNELPIELQRVVYPASAAKADARR